MFRPWCCRAARRLFELDARLNAEVVSVGSEILAGQIADTNARFISEALASCFYHADSLHVETIALPLLGTGKGGFSEAVCLDTMSRFLARMLLRDNVRRIFNV